MCLMSRWASNVFACGASCQSLETATPDLRDVCCEMQGPSHVLLLPADGRPDHVQQPGRAASPHGGGPAHGAQRSPLSAQGAVGAWEQSHCCHFEISGGSRSPARRMATGASWTDAHWPTAPMQRFARSWWSRARPHTRPSLDARTLAHPWRLSSTPCQAHDSSVFPRNARTRKSHAFLRESIDLVSLWGG